MDIESERDYPLIAAVRAFGGIVAAHGGFLGYRTG
jgi:hypothetical protein